MLFLSVESSTASSLSTCTSSIDIPCSTSPTVPAGTWSGTFLTSHGKIKVSLKKETSFIILHQKEDKTILLEPTAFGEFAKIPLKQILLHSNQIIF